MNKDEEGPRNIKLVRYTHPGPRAWKDGLERSNSLPPREKRKGDGRLIDMLKSRSAKFHNITVGRNTGAAPKDRVAGSKHHEPFFLPTRTVNPLRTSESTMQRVNLDGALATGNQTGPSFTASVKQMLLEHRSQIGSLQDERAPQDSLRNGESSARSDEVVQKELIRLQQKTVVAEDAELNKDEPASKEGPRLVEESPQENENREHLLSEQPLKPSEPEGLKEHNSETSAKGSDHDSQIIPLVEKGVHEFAGLPETQSSALALKGEISEHKELQSSQSLPGINRTTSARSNLLRLFSQVDQEMHSADSASNNRVLRFLNGKRDQIEELSDEPEDTRSLQGCVVAFEGELGSADDSGTSKLQVVYLSDDEEKALKKHKVLPPGSGVLRRASPRRLMPTLTDPSAEKRKNDREVAIDVLVKLKDKRTYDRKTIAELVEKGVPNHRALEGNSCVSVTNDVCSVNNYETSHAYYYQQLDKRSKLSWIPLHAAPPDNGQPPKEIWRNELQASLVSCCVFFYSVEPSKLQGQQRLAMEHQITQLKRILQTRFLVKLADSLDKKVDVVILYGQNEKLLSELVQKRLKNMPFRVWSLQKALDFLEDVDVDLKEWGIPRNAQDHEPVVDTPIQVLPDIPKPKVVIESETDNGKDTDNNDQYVQELLQQASDALDKRDNQLMSARKIMLALSKNVMNQELQITSLTGQLKNSQKELQNQKSLTEQYRLCMAEQELEMAQLRDQLSRKKSKKGDRHQKRVSKGR